MNRRDAVCALLALGVAPFSSFAQQPGKVWRIGWLLTIRRPESESHFTNAFARGMHELGYVEGRNVVYERRFSDGKGELLPGLAAGLVQLKVDLIVVSSSPATAAAQKATSTIPIVFLVDSDPVGNGFVAGLARPGGNITGQSALGVELSAKHLEMLRSLVPKLSRVAVLMNPDDDSQATMLKSVQAAGQSTGVAIQSFDARLPQELENAFAQAVRWKAGGLIVARGPFSNSQVRPIAELAARHRLPTIAGLAEYVNAGGLISYGANLSDLFRRGATYVDKIFKGAKPGDLPVEQAAVFEMFVNRKAAKALGLTLPQSLLAIADKVIE